MTRRLLGWTALSLILLGLILVPFVWFGEWFDSAAQSLAGQPAAGPAIALLLAGMLAGDIVLPVPSSLISTMCGYLYGFAGGAALSWAGMNAGALLGYWLGAAGGRPLTRRLVGEPELARASRAHERWGAWSLIVSRAVPVLAEASVVFAGAARMRVKRFILLTFLSNLGISAAYAAAGAFAAGVESFLLAFAGAIALPGIAMLLARRRHV